MTAARARMQRLLLLSPFSIGFRQEKAPPQALLSFEAFCHSLRLPLTTLCCDRLFSDACRRLFRRRRAELNRTLAALDRRRSLSAGDLELALSIRASRYRDLEKLSPNDEENMTAIADAVVWMHLHGLDHMEDLTQYEPQIELPQPPRGLIAHLSQRLLLPRIGRLRPDAVGISCLVTEQLGSALIVAAQLRAKGFQRPVILGGAGVTMIPEEDRERLLRDHPGVTALAMDDGRAVIRALIEGRFASEWRRMPNLIVRAGDRIERTRVVRPKPSTAEIGLLPPGAAVAPGDVVDVEVSRGCFWARCAYCDIPYLERCAGGEVAFKDPEVLVSEVERLLRGRPSNISLLTSSLSPAYIRRLHAVFAPRRFPRVLSSFVRADGRFTSDDFERLAACGVGMITIGAESLSDAVLRRMRKGATRGQIVRMIRRARAAGIEVYVNLIRGFPGEGLAEARESCRAVRALKGMIAGVRISPFVLSVWSHMYVGRQRLPIALLPQQREPLSRVMPFVRRDLRPGDAARIDALYRDLAAFFDRTSTDERCGSPEREVPEGVSVRSVAGLCLFRVRYGQSLRQLIFGRGRRFRPSPRWIAARGESGACLSAAVAGWVEKIRRRKTMPWTEVPRPLRRELGPLFMRGLLERW